MEIQSQKLSEFFNIGRDRGWDVERQAWTVHSLVDPEGRVLTLGEVLDGIPLDLRLAKSGNRYGYPPLRERIIASQRYDVAAEHVLVTSGTQHANFLAFASTLERGDEAIVESMLTAADKINAKGHELRDAAAAGDIARIEAITKEAGPLGTDSDHQFDAYGLQVCGSNFNA